MVSPCEPISFFKGIDPSISENLPNWTPVKPSPVAYGRNQDYHVEGLATLRPTATSLCPFTTHMICQEILSESVVPWGRKLFKNCLEKNSVNVDWIRHMLIHESKILIQAGIYEAVFLSMFKYDMNTTLLQAFVERWNYSTNTLLTGEKEMSITLWDLRQLTGLPIQGLPYDEYVPLSKNSSVWHVCAVYDLLAKDKPGVSCQDWARHFTDLIRHPSKGFADTKNALGIDQSDAVYIDPPPQHERESIHSHGYSRETQLTAFLAWWLGYFVLPSQWVGKIRRSTFIMANLMAQGKRISLAIPALANIYQTLRLLCVSLDPSVGGIVIPWHFIYGWLNMYWRGVCPSALPEKLRKGLPFMADIAGGIPKAFAIVPSRLYFDGVSAHLQNHNEREVDRVFSFKGDRENDRVLLDNKHKLTTAKGCRDFEFLVSIRYGYLPLRLESQVILEPYSPHRCAHQFGFDQEIPHNISRPATLSATLEDVGKCWLSLLRRNSKCHYFVPALSRVPRFSALYKRWYNGLIPSISPLPSDFVKKMTNRDAFVITSDKKNRISNVQASPPDFHGCDSRLAPLDTSGKSSLPSYHTAGTFSS